MPPQGTAAESSKDHNQWRKVRQQIDAVEREMDGIFPSYRFGVSLG